MQWTINDINALYILLLLLLLDRSLGKMMSWSVQQESVHVNIVKTIVCVCVYNNAWFQYVVRISLILCLLLSNTLMFHISQFYLLIYIRESFIFVYKQRLDWSVIFSHLVVIGTRPKQLEKLVEYDGVSCNTS